MVIVNEPLGIVQALATADLSNIVARPRFAEAGP